MSERDTRNGTDYEATPLTRPEYISAVVHLYRGEMHRALTWRQRLDTTTNWAVFTTGALLSFLFSADGAQNHVVGVLGMMLVFSMLCFEGRRFRYFDVWRNRVRKLEENFYAPLLRRDLSSPVENWGFVVAEDLLTPRFKISYLTAMRARLIRNYIPIFIVLFCAWFGKLIVPSRDSQMESFGAALENAQVGPVPWQLVVTGVCTLAAFLLYVATLCGPKRSDETIWWSHLSDESVDEVS